MGFLERAKNAIARLMYGRNGVDQLNQALVFLYVGLCVLEIFLNMFLHNGMVTRVFEAVLFAMMVFIFFRMFSKNLAKRREENRRWVSFWQGLQNRRLGARERHADTEHKYFTCKACKTICRVPVGKGKIIITCPKCGAQIQAKT